MPSTRSPEAAGAPPVRYRIHHTTRYLYGDEIQLSHHLAHLSPRAAPRQHVITAALDIHPLPALLTRHRDFFGNEATYFEMHAPHGRLEIRSTIEIEVTPPAPIDPDAGPAWEAVRDALMEAGDPDARAAAAFAFSSRFVPALAELADYAAPSFVPGRPIAAALLDLTTRIHADFAFDTTATTIATPILEVLKERRGVCQDFAHLAIGCLRAQGLAARYVSGYLRTLPPPGKPRLVGADFSHAWLSAWCGGDFWLDLDPTNGRPGSADMIAIAWGRDYDDVSPVRGTFLGTRHQKLTVEVDVEPVG